MKIPATLQPLLDATRREVPSLLKQLQVGQVVQGKVLAQLQPGLLRLQIATTVLLARSQIAIEPGTLLKLEVAKGQPLPELRVLREPTPRDLQQQAARSALGRQLPAAEVRQALAEIRNPSSTPRQMDAVERFAAILREAGVRPGSASVAQIQRAIAQSGIFHEARLASGLPTDTGDTKVRLLQLLTQLYTAAGSTAPKGSPPPATGGEQQPAPQATGGDSLLSRLIRLVEGSVSRIQLQQAAVLPVEDGQRQAWQLDLPIQLPGETHEAMLRIEREAAGDDAAGEAPWAVNLAFRFDTIGTLQCRVALSGERVSTTFWCERQQTLENVERRLPALKEALEAQGLEVVHLAGVLGEPAEPLIGVPVPDVLLDERA